MFDPAHVTVLFRARSRAWAFASRVAALDGDEEPAPSAIAA
jgi:hypothetical protein